jgi:hypothetical protein
MSTTHSIALAAAAELTERFRNNRNTILQSNYQNQDLLPLSETFSKTALMEVLGREECTALRIYPGMAEDLKIHAILVGVDEDNADILPPQNTLAETGDDYILEDGQRCPPACPPPSTLNTGE